jgi:phosphatidylglycerophosphate synthase
VSAAADALGLARLVIAVVFPGVLAHAIRAAGGGWWPLGLFAIAAASDFFDGILARRARHPTRHGAALDSAADVLFVLSATGAAALLGRVPWAVPTAIAVAASAYALASRRRGGDGSWRPARSRLGHAGGVANYALVGLIAGSAALPGARWGPVLRAASLVVVAVNLSAVLERLWPRAPARRARGPRGEGTGARSGRSSP